MHLSEGTAGLNGIGHSTMYEELATCSPSNIPRSRGHHATLDFARCSFLSLVMNKTGCHLFVLQSFSEKADGHVPLLRS